MKHDAFFRTVVVVASIGFVLCGLYKWLVRRDAPSHLAACREFWDQPRQETPSRCFRDFDPQHP